MPGLVIIVMAVFVGAITGVFSKVPNQKVTGGTIVSVEHKYDTGERRPTYTAIVEYEVNDVVYSVKSRYKSASYRIGQPVKVAYDAADPQNSLIRPSVSVYVVMILLIIAGIIIARLTYLKG